MCGLSCYFLSSSIPHATDMVSLYRENVPIQWFFNSFLPQCEARRLMIFSAFNRRQISMTEWPFEYKAMYNFSPSFITNLGRL